MNLLTTKIASIELFNETYPGFGGYLPWFDVADGKMILKSPDWLDRTPGLDNGEMLWAMMGASKVLADNNETQLGQRYRNYVDYMASTVLPGVGKMLSPGCVSCVVGVPCRLFGVAWYWHHGHRPVTPGSAVPTTHPHLVSQAIACSSHRTHLPVQCSGTLSATVCGASSRSATCR